MSSTALSATNKIESNKIVRKIRRFTKKCTNNTKLLTKHIDYIIMKLRKVMVK